MNVPFGKHTKKGRTKCSHTAVSSLISFSKLLPDRK